MNVLEQIANFFRTMSVQKGSPEALINQMVEKLEKLKECELDEVDIQDLEDAEDLIQTVYSQFYKECN